MQKELYNILIKSIILFIIVLLITKFFLPNDLSFYSSFLVTLIFILFNYIEQIIWLFGKEKIKIKSFWLKKDWWENHQCYELIKWKELTIKDNIVKENFPRPLLYNNYNFPEFEILIQNNSENSEVIEDIKFKINKIESASNWYIWIHFIWKEVYNKTELTWDYNNISFEFNNLSYNSINDFQIHNINIYDEKWHKIENVVNNNEKYNIDSNKSEKINFITNRISEIKNIIISKIIFKVTYEINWKKVTEEYYFTPVWNKRYAHMFYDNENGFYMIVGEIWWWWYWADDVWKYIIKTSLWKDIVWKTLHYPLKRIIESKNIDNFTFYVWVDIPSIVYLTIILDFWDKKITKDLKLNLYYPTSFNTELFMQNAKILI